MKIATPLLLATLTTCGMNSPQICYESEEVTLTLRNNDQNPKTLHDGLLEDASFSNENNFMIGELVVIKNGLLSTFNLPRKVSKKIVKITDIRGSKHTFEIINKVDEQGNPIVKREVTIDAPELLGKIPQAIASALVTSLN